MDSDGLGCEMKWRVGSVPYLNARPLIETLGSGVELAVPRELGARFVAGEYDAALVPIFVGLERGGGRIVDGVGIGCDGAVHSVFLAYRGDLGGVRSVAMDPASRTSANLLRCLLWEFLGMDFAEISGEAAQDARGDGVAKLIIGDPAIKFRAAHPDWSFLDLGEEWKRWTGLPFVFACWVLGDRLRQAEAAGLADALRQAKASGVDLIGEIAAREADAEFARWYLTRCLCFDLGEREWEAMARFAELCGRHGLVNDGEARFVGV